ncbi:MAG: DNA polymerase III subunit gamma/tau [Bacteroidetes bacterium]|jgi:DNA polymerase III subunit gamma/tau|nr:DNA polymerase III subunit gamma/tau [Bacteroidota bacterium]
MDSNNPTYTVSALKYRPQVWDAVVGQEGITRTLRQAIEQNQVAQAYLFCGPRGVGKTTSARIFARAINDFDADAGEDYAFNVFELDAASNNKVEDIRSIVDQVRIPPQRGKYKVYIIDEVHMLSQAAFNAFLKTLEEPPPHAVFVLATTEKHKILPTILSRCQIFDFHRITVPDMVLHLQGICAKEGIEAEEAALHVVAVKADGALRDALSIFDQLVAFAGKKLTYEVVAEHLHVLDHQTYFEVLRCALAGEVASALLVLDGIMARGFDPHHFISGLGAHLRNLLVSKDASTVKLMEGTDDLRRQFVEQSQQTDLHFLVQAMDHVNQADVQYRGSNHQRLLVELTLMQICSLRGVDKKKNSLIAIQADAWRANRSAKQAEAAPVKRIEPAQVSVPDVEETNPLVPALKSAAEAIAPPTLAAAAQPVNAAANPEVGVLKKRKISLTKPKSLQPLEVSAPIEKKEFQPELREHFDVSRLQEVWKAFAAIQKEAEKLNLSSTLLACSVGLDGEQVQIVLLNKVQEEQVKEIRVPLFEFLRSELKNDFIELNLAVPAAETLEVSSQFLTERERYDVFVDKNPHLDTLRKRLDLDLG